MGFSLVLKVLVPVAVVAGTILWLIGPRLRGRFWVEWARPRLVAAGILLTGLGAGVFLWRVLYSASHH